MVCAHVICSDAVIVTYTPNATALTTAFKTLCTHCHQKPTTFTALWKHKRFYMRKYIIWKFGEHLFCHPPIFSVSCIPLSPNKIISKILLHFPKSTQNIKLGLRVIANSTNLCVLFPKKIQNSRNGLRTNATITGKMLSNLVRQTTSRATGYPDYLHFPCATARISGSDGGDCEHVIAT